MRILRCFRLLPPVTVSWSRCNHLCCVDVSARDHSPLSLFHHHHPALVFSVAQKVQHWNDRSDADQSVRLRLTETSWYR
uniref:Putative secreted protein n=1 Tax=Anopheles marajoara TaxID=58244 RepID=A0A2M4CD39_9DIPT